MVAVTDYMRGDLGGVFSSLTGMGKKFMNQNTGAVERSKQQNTSPADAISWSGCKDTQTSADAVEAGQATGAMSYAFITALTKYPQRKQDIVFLLSMEMLLNSKMLLQNPTFSF